MQSAISFEGGYRGATLPTVSISTLLVDGP